MALRVTRRWAIAIVTSALLAGAFVSFQVAQARTATYLVAGSSSWMPGDRTTGQSDFELPVVNVAYRHGERYGYGVSVRNKGSRAVRIEGFPLVSRAPLAPVEVRIGRDPSVVSPDNSIPFRAFTLSPGKERMIYFFGRFTGCERSDAGTAVIQGALEVRYKVLWFRRTADVTMMEALRINFPGPNTPECPLSRPHP